MQFNFLNCFLIGTVLLVIPLLWWTKKLASPIANPQVNALVTRNWLFFLMAILFLRAIVGTLLIFHNAGHGAVASFYPIRIAFPNYHLIGGTAYILLNIGILCYLRQISDFIAKVRLNYLVLWLSSILLSILFGAIHGGLITGNISIANDANHLYDASLNNSLSQIFITHTPRILGQLTPSYRSAHTLSHPSISLAYWQLMSHTFPPVIFSLFNVLFFSLAFPIAWWALQQLYPNQNTLLIVMACMLTPGLLVYGRSDDAIYYALAAIIMALTAVSFTQSRYWLTCFAGLLFAVAMNFSYASLILLPALILFNTPQTLNQIWKFLYRVTPHVFLTLVTLLVTMTFLQKYLGYNYMQEFFACAKHSVSNNIVDMVHKGIYWEVVNARLMTICDLLLFGGPLFLYLFYKLFQQANWNIGSWLIKNIALTVCLIVLLINSNGPGEIARPWGSLYLIVGFAWLPWLFSSENESTGYWLIKAQFCWALILQIPLNFGW